MSLTKYKVGDTINGDKRGFYLKVKKVYSDGDIDVSVNAPSGYSSYEYKVGNGSWAKMYNGGNHHISNNTVVYIRATKKGTPETKEVSPWSWFGNYWSKNTIVYGYGPTLYKKGSNAKPVWSDSVSKLVGVTGINKSEWEYVPGTYRWATTESYGTFGWTDGGYKGAFVDPITKGKNRYARRIKYKIRKKKVPDIVVQASIRVDGIGTPDTTKPNIVVKDQLNSNRVIPDYEVYERTKDVKPYWEESSKFNWSISNATYTDINGKKSNFTMSNGKTLKEYGTYTFTITAVNKETPSIKDSKSYTIVIKDNVPPPDFIIYEKNNKSIIYDMSNKVYLGPCHPTIDIPSQCDAEAVLNGNSYTLGSPVSENGYYEITVTIKKRTNNKTRTKQGNFTIDNTPPEPPIIDIGDGNLYQGRDYGLIHERFPNPINMKIKVETGATIVDRKVWYKKDLYSEWKEIPSSNSMTFSNKGVYKITARAKKNSNGLYSDYTTLEVYKKNKYTWTITLNPNDLCYRTIATVNFSNDPTLKKMYKIDDGPWMWYRDPIKIYKNCILYVKSLDGDDNYESNITSKKIDIIDTYPPEPPKIIGVEEGDIVVGTVIPRLAD
jgi:hypothetical protein